MTTRKVIRRLLPTIALLLALLWFLHQPGSLPPIPSRGGPAALGPAGNPSPGSAQAPPVDGPLTVTYPPALPAPIDLATVRQAPPSPDGRSLPLLRPEATIPGEDRLRVLRAAARERPPSTGLQPATTEAAASPLVTFDAIDYNQSGRMTPPDPELAVGVDAIVVAVNTAVAVYDKSGNLLFGPTAAADLFTHPSCRSGLYDPNVVYDEAWDRWILAFDQGAHTTDGGYCLLASRGPDPTGEWIQYFFPLNDGNVWLDFPHAGVGDRYLFMGANMFDHQSPSRFVEGRLFAFDKQALYDPATPVAAVSLRLGGTYDTPQPLHLHGARQASWPAYGNMHYFLAEPWDGRHYTLFRWNPTLPVGSLSEVTVGTLDLGSGDDRAADLVPVNVPQLDGDDLEANDFRPLDFEYRNGYGWTAMTVACNPGSTAVNCVRWAQIDLADAALGPAGVGLYGSADLYRFFPDLAVNQCGDMLIGYSRSGAGEYPGIWVAGRYASDLAGLLRGEQQLRAGDRPYTSAELLSSPGSARRWGDYTGLAIDPDGITFWYLGQYSKDIVNGDNTNWGTYAGSFTLSPDLTCNPPTASHLVHLPLVRAASPPPGPSLVALKQEDFEGPFPNEWLVADANGGDFHWAKTDCRANAGNYSGGAVAAAVACGDPYPANVESWMIFGPFDLADAVDAALEFDVWNRTEVTGDDFFWGVSLDGQSFAGYLLSGDSGGWQPQTLDLKNAPVLGDLRGQAQVWIAFMFSSDESVESGEGSYVDNVYLWKDTGGSRFAVTATPNSEENGGLLRRPATRVLRAPTAP